MFCQVQEQIILLNIQQPLPLIYLLEHFILTLQQTLGSQNMKAPQHFSMDQESPPTPILIRLPSTPTKNPPQFPYFQDPEFRHQMMLVETPVKEQPELIDTLLEPDSPMKEFYEEEEESPMMEQEISQSFFHEEVHEGTENQEPNIYRSRSKIDNPPKFGQEKEQKQNISNPTFKTPGRSHRSNTLSTAHKRKPCTCKKSGCLKKYCECYKAGEACDENCDCVGCKNNDPVYAKSGTKSSIKGVPTVCNCKKSGCIKGYCDCHNGGAFCSQLCNCIECKNQMFIPSDFQAESNLRKPRRVHWEDKESLMEEEFVDLI